MTSQNQVHQLDCKVHRLLIWSNIAVIMSYFLVVGVIGRIYYVYSGNNPAFFIGCLIAVYLLLSIYLFVVGKELAYHKSTVKHTTKNYLDHQIAKLNGKRKLVAAYLFLYALMLGVSAIFFCIDIRNGLTMLFKVLTPVSLITYGSGLYFMLSLSRQKNKLALLNKQLAYLSIMEKVNQN